MKLTLRSLLAPLLLAALPLPSHAAETAPPDPDAPPVWAASLGEAVERARAMKDGRLLVELRDAACAGCERMEKLVYPTASFFAFVKDKVPVSVQRGTPDGDRLVARFRVRTLPAWLVVTPDLLLCGKQEGESNQSTWIERFVEAERGWAAFRRKVEDARRVPGDAELAFAVAEETFKRFDDAGAEEQFRKVLSSPGVSAELRGRSLAYLATIALEARRLDDAEKALAEIVATAEDPALREKAELRLADVDLGRGERTKAADRLREFLANHPGSPLRGQAEALLGAIAPAASPRSPE